MKHLTNSQIDEHLAQHNQELSHGLNTDSASLSWSSNHSNWRGADCWARYNLAGFGRRGVDQARSGTHQQLGRCGSRWAFRC